MTAGIRLTLARAVHPPWVFFEDLVLGLFCEVFPSEEFPDVLPELRAGFVRVV